MFFCLTMQPTVGAKVEGKSSFTTNFPPLPDYKTPECQCQWKKP